MFGLIFKEVVSAVHKFELHQERICAEVSEHHAADTIVHVNISHHSALPLAGAITGDPWECTGRIMENIDLTCDHQQKYQLEMHQRTGCVQAAAARD